MKPTPPLQMYDNFFPIKKIKLKPKDLKSPLIKPGQDNCQVFPKKIVVNKKNNPNIESIDIILIAFLLTLVQI